MTSESDFVHNDPTPGTPFLRSECTGQCVGITGMEAHSHGHGHSHRPAVPSVSVVPATPLVSSARRRTLAKASEDFAIPAVPAPPPSSRRKTQTPSILLDEARVTKRVRRESSTPITPQVEKRLKGVLDLENPLRTDYTYGASATYQAKPPTPEWENPRMSRQSLHGRKTRLVLSASHRSLFTSFISWLRGETTVETTTVLSTPPKLSNGKTPNAVIPPSPSVRPRKGGVLISDDEDSEDEATTPRVSVGRRLLDQSSMAATSSVSVLVYVVTTIVSLLLRPFAFARALGARSVGGAKTWWTERSRLAEERRLSHLIDDEIISMQKFTESETMSMTEEIPLMPEGSEETRPSRRAVLCGFCPLFLCLLFTAALLAALCAGGAAETGASVLRVYVFPLPFLFFNKTKEAATAAHTNFVTPLWASLAHIGHGHSHVSIPPDAPTIAPPVVQQTVVHSYLPAPEPEVRKEDVERLAALLAGLEAKLGLIGADCCKDPPSLAHLASTTALEEIRMNVRRLELSVASAEGRIDAIPPPLPPLPPQEKVIVKETIREVATGGGGGLEVGAVEALIGAAIARYDADKTGLADFALESAGGSVISTRCSESYSSRTRTESVLGIPLWFLTYSPRVVIQPGVQPGECWAFKGPTGFLLIQLNGWIDISAVSLEHIPKSLSPDGHIESAPKDFQVWGLNSEDEKDGQVLGSFHYDTEGPPLQTFPVQQRVDGGFPYVELKIQSNHGHPVYTCLYRFRVHGTRLRPAYGKP